MTSKRVRKKHGELEEEIENTKVFRLKPQKDEMGRYYPICTFSFHCGINLSEDICMAKHCKHLKRAYIDENRNYRYFGSGQNP
jgi:hypothetical protein